IAEAYALVGCIGHDIECDFTGRAQHDAIARGNDVVLIGLAAIGALDALCAGAWPDVLALMAKAARAVAHIERTMLAKVVAPGVGVIDRFICHQGQAVDPAAIPRGLAKLPDPQPSGLVTVAPVIEGLRVGESRRLGQWKSHLGIDRVVGPAGMPP